MANVCLEALLIIAARLPARCQKLTDPSSSLDDLRKRKSSTAHQPCGIDLLLIDDTLLVAADTLDIAGGGMSANRRLSASATAPTCLKAGVADEAGRLVSRGPEGGLGCLSRFAVPGVAHEAVVGLSAGTQDQSAARADQAGRLCAGHGDARRPSLGWSRRRDAEYSQARQRGVRPSDHHVGSQLVRVGLLAILGAA
jgi:hypothetical protein